MSRYRVAVLADLLEEGWPSMDLVAEMLVAGLAEHPAEVEATLVRPRMRRRFTLLPGVGASGPARNADRLLNRAWHYGRAVGDRGGRYDLFHLVDHSYGAVAHFLPAERTVVTCHDLDAFRCLLDPEAEPRSLAFRAMTRRILGGMQRATRVICVSATVRDEVVARGLLPVDRVVVIPNGVHPSCGAGPSPGADQEAERLLGPRSGQNVELLHVGSTIPRKRIDVLLRTFAAVKRTFPSARLIRVGGEFSFEQRRLARDLGVEAAIRVLPHLDREVLAAVYRRADLVLQPSEREGFGLPVVEALACGTPVLASDLPVFREIAEGVAAFAPMGDVEAWSAAASRLLGEARSDPQRWADRRHEGVVHARRYSWSANAARTLEVYQEILA